MADAAEEMEAVLSGKAWDVGGGVGGSAEPHIPVRLGSSVCYVVLAVLFNAEVRRMEVLHPITPSEPSIP